MKQTKNILSEKERELVEILMADCQNTGDIQAKLKRLFAGTIEQMLEAEMDEHLGYDKNSVLGNNSGNSRNGYNHKTIISDYGESEIAIPRDRNGEFEPKVPEKRQVRTDEIEQKIPAMYSKGMSQRDIEDNLREIYGAEIPQTLISKITDKILPEVNEWQNRPLEAIYPIVYFDGIIFKSRKDSQIVNKCVYSVLGIDMDGRKDIPGCWISENRDRKIPARARFKRAFFAKRKIMRRRKFLRRYMLGPEKARSYGHFHSLPRQSEGFKRSGERRVP